MDGFCRACLNKYEDPSELIQYTEKNRRLFVYLTGLQVKRNDQLTFQLCKECYPKMKLACKFKKLCRTSDKRFQNYVALNNTGDTIDFHTYLKNNDVSPFRFPLMSGNSTPANLKGRDDDNESTCTSIRNFMTDILQGEEIPDTEARIVREVIEEEADVLDDSLDSHWLQDDLSIDSEFKMDFSFSQFSTPRAYDDHCYTPKRLDNQKADQDNYYASNNLENGDKNDEDVYPGDKDVYPFININETSVKDEAITELQLGGNRELEDNVDIKEFVETNQIVDGKGEEIMQHVLNFYVPMDTSDGMNDCAKLTKQCTIDRNLEMALENEENREFSLDGLLVSPPVFNGVSGVSTPTINNILFGEKLDTPVKVTAREIDKCKVDYDNIEIINEILKNVPDEYKPLDNDVNKENDAVDLNEIANINDDGVETKSNGIIVMNVDSNGNDGNTHFDLGDFYCKLCDKKFNSIKALSVHFTKIHKIKLVKTKSNKYYRNPMLCNICGKEYSNKPNYLRHMKIHQKLKKQDSYKCSVCPLECTSEAKLRMHMVIHNVKYVKKDTGKSYLCKICGVVCNNYGNFQLHQKRHTKEYTMKCEECGRGFYRLGDLNIHMRCHTGERPYPCLLCPKKFARREGLAKHIRWHSAEDLYECEYCGTSFVKRNQLKSHMKKSKKCLQIQSRLAVNKLAEVDVIYKAVDNDSLVKELPFLDTENSI